MGSLFPKSVFLFNIIRVIGQYLKAFPEGLLFISSNAIDLLKYAGGYRDWETPKIGRAHV